MSTDSRPIDPQRAQDVAREFDMLQGLTLVAAGVGMMLFGALFGSSPGVVIIFLALGIDHFEQLPVLLSMLTTAVLLWVGVRLGARRLGMRPIDHVVPAGLAASSLAPLVVGPAGGFPAISFYFLVTGIALVALGVAWHRRLVSVMSSPDAS